MEGNSKGKFFITYVIRRFDGINNFSNMTAIVEYKSFEDLLCKCENLVQEKQIINYSGAEKITILGIKEVECYVLEPYYTRTEKEVAANIINMIEEMCTYYQEKNEKAKQENKYNMFYKLINVDTYCRAACSTLSVLKNKIYSKYLYEDKEEE